MPNNLQQLAQFATAAPQHAKTLLVPVLSQPEEHQDIIKNYTDFHTLYDILSYLNLYDQFLAKITTNPLEFERLITTFDELEYLLGNAKRLSDPDAFQKKIIAYSEREEFAQESEDYQASYKAVLQHRKTLTESGQPFPNYTHRIITLVTANHELFQRLVKTECELQTLAALFPKIKILQSKTITDVVCQIKEYKNAKNYASTIAQGIRDKTTLFSALGSHLLLRIAKESTNEQLTDSKTLDAVIKKGLKL